MRLVRLIYASSIKNNTDPTELKTIHEQALASNAKENITGMLVFGNGYFLQCIEGGRETINRLYQKILLDKRHERSTLLEYTEASQREFDEWTMKLVLLTAEKMKLLRRFSAANDFDPYALSAGNALEFMRSLKN